jgi:hypothetical protein
MTGYNNPREHTGVEVDVAAVPVDTPLTAPPHEVEHYVAVVDAVEEDAVDPVDALGEDE